MAIDDRFRQLFLNRASRSRAPIDSLDDVIEEARAWCTEWKPEDFAVFSWWIQCGFPDWAVSVPGWQAMTLDAIADDLPAQHLGGATFHAWKVVTSPQEYLLTARWRELFRRGGYVEGLQVVQRPATTTLVLYRGADWETRANWSWTSTYEIAEIYRQQHGGPGALVWVALVPGENVLARQLPTSLGHRCDYDEFVVDTMRRDKPGWTIPIRPLDLPARRSHWPHCRTSRASARFMSHRCLECGAQVGGGRTAGTLNETTEDAFLNRSPASRRVAGAIT